jgi:molecular chaperone GrpE
MFSDKDKEAPKDSSENEAAPQENQAADPLAAKINEYREQMLRLRAEFDNTKKRLEKDKQDSIKFANEKLLIELLQAVDNFDRALLSLTDGHDPELVKKGLKIAQEELHKVLERYGVEPVKSLGEAFDPNLHEAVAVVPSADAKEGTIMDEVQRGYRLNGRLIRPSRVRIASKNT